MVWRSDAGVYDTASGAAPEHGALSTITEGERRLMTAVLVHALRSLLQDAERPGRGAARRLQQDLRWLTSADRDDLFSFERICESLALDADRVRQHALTQLGAITQFLSHPSAPDRDTRRLGATLVFAPAASVA